MHSLPTMRRSEAATPTRSLGPHINSHILYDVTDLIMLAERLPHLLQLLLQLLLVAVAKLLAAHLLGGGEGVESLLEVELVFLFQ